MSENSNGNYRLDRMEKDITETKAEVKEMASEQVVQGNKLISMGSDLKQNLATNVVIKNATITFLVVNVLGLIWVFMKSLY